MNEITTRLRGKYSCGPEGVREDRDFGDYTPAINKEAADYIEQLEKQVRELKASNELIKNLFIKYVLQVDTAEGGAYTTNIDRISPAHMYDMTVTEDDKSLYEREILPSVEQWNQGVKDWYKAVKNIEV